MEKEEQVNPVRKALLERRSQLPEEVLRQLDETEKKMDEDFRPYQLRVIKRSKVALQTGDVFVAQPRDNLYFYGIVINANIAMSGFGGGEDYSVVMIFKQKAQSITDMGFEADYDSLLIGPHIVCNEYWRKGYFYNIGLNKQIPEDLDYGFYKSFYQRFIDEYENLLDEQPKLMGGYGVATMTGIAAIITRELIMDPVLAEPLLGVDEKELEPVDMSVQADDDEDDVEDIRAEGYVFKVNHEDSVSVVLDAEDPKVLAIGDQMEALNEAAYMNGYNWEAFFKHYLVKHAPEVMKGMDTDPEAGMYVAYYPRTEENETRAAQFVEIIRSLIENEEELYRIVREEGEKIDWD